MSPNSLSRLPVARPGVAAAEDVEILHLRNESLVTVPNSVEVEEAVTQLFSITVSSFHPHDRDRHSRSICFDPCWDLEQASWRWYRATKLRDRP